jgi:hypothetical protein
MEMNTLLCKKFKKTQRNPLSTYQKKLPVNQNQAQMEQEWERGAI